MDDREKQPWVFLSYNTQDIDHVAEFRERMIAEFRGSRMRLEVRMEENPAGVMTEDIETAIRRSCCFVLTCGPSGLGNIQQMERNAAARNRLKILAAVLHGGQLPNATLSSKTVYIDRDEHDPIQEICELCRCAAEHWGVRDLPPCVLDKRDFKDSSSLAKRLENAGLRLTFAPPNEPPSSHAGRRADGAPLELSHYIGPHEGAHKSARFAIIHGRPGIGKSSLLHRLVAEDPSDAQRNRLLVKAEHMLCEQGQDHWPAARDTKAVERDLDTLVDIMRSSAEGDRQIVLFVDGLDIACSYLGAIEQRRTDSLLMEWTSRLRTLFADLPATVVFSCDDDIGGTKRNSLSTMKEGLGRNVASRRLVLCAEDFARMKQLDRVLFAQGSAHSHLRIPLYFDTLAKLGKQNDDLSKLSALRGRCKRYDDGRTPLDLHPLLRAALYVDRVITALKDLFDAGETPRTVCACAATLAESISWEGLYLLKDSMKRYENQVWILHDALVKGGMEYADSAALSNTVTMLSHCGTQGYDLTKSHSTRRSQRGTYVFEFWHNNLRTAVLSKAALYGCRMFGVDLTDVVLDRATIEDKARFIACSMKQATHDFLKSRATVSYPRIVTDDADQ